MDKEELYETILISPTYKYPLLNEIYAIRDKNLETEDYTIAVNGFISVDSLLDNYNLINEKQQLISFLEENIRNRLDTVEFYENQDIQGTKEELEKTVSRLLAELNIYQEVLDFVNKGGKE